METPTDNQKIIKTSKKCFVSETLPRQQMEIKVGMKLCRRHHGRNTIRLSLKYWRPQNEGSE